MLKHYLISALRHLDRFRLATAVNVFCLALGLACLILTYAVITFVSKSDAHFAKADRIQIISVDLNAPAANLRFRGLPLTGPVVAAVVETDVPQLEAVARRTQGGQAAVSTGETATFAAVTYADSQLLDMLDFQFIAGAGSASLRTPHSVVLTAEAAERVFGTANVVGRSLRIANRQDVTVTGVIAEIPQPTRFGFELLVSMDVHEALRAAAGAAPASAGNFGDWMWLQDAYLTYVLLPSDGSLQSAELVAQLAEVSRRHVPKHEGGNTLQLGAVPLQSMFISMMNSQFQGFSRTGISVVAMGYVLAGLVLIIACLNYANLASAMTTARSKEVGLRKVLGASRRQVAGQQLLETALIGAVALISTLLLVAVLMPLVKRAGFDITYAVLLQPEFLVFLVALIAVVTIAGGIYPAWVISSIRPTQALRAGSAHEGRRFAPAMLVVTQFATCSFLLIVVLVMRAQNAATLRVGDTLTDDPVIALSTSLDTADVSLEVLRTRLLASPLFKSVSASQAVPLRFTSNPLPLTRSPDPATNPTTASINNVYYDFSRTLGITIVAGRDFARERGEDIHAGWEEDRSANVIIGAALAAQLGWSEPSDAVGQTLYFRFGANLHPMQVIGVAEEKPLHVIGMGANSSIYFLTPSSAAYVVARISGEDVAGALAHLDATWKELSPHVPARYQFLDELIEQSYRPVLTFSRLMSGLALFGTVIAGVGLFGMAIYMIGRRTHEIGVRKTLGARTGEIFAMLLRDLSKPVVIANLIAWPLAFVAARIYLRLFAERVDLTLLPFVAGLVIALLIAWVAVASRAYRAASASPAPALRYE